MFMYSKTERRSLIFHTGINLRAFVESMVSHGGFPLLTGGQSRVEPPP